MATTFETQLARALTEQHYTDAEIDAIVEAYEDDPPEAVAPGLSPAATGLIFALKDSLIGHFERKLDDEWIPPAKQLDAWRRTCRENPETTTLVGLFMDAPIENFTGRVVLTPKRH